MYMGGRWQCLLKRNDSDLPCLVAACCVLHNICESHHEAFNDDWIQDDPNSLSNSQNCQSQATSTMLNPLTTVASVNVIYACVLCLQ